VRKVTEHPMDTTREQEGNRGSRAAGGGAPRPAPSQDSTVVTDAMALQAEIRAEQALLESGTPGRATITGFTDTGVLVNFNPQVVLDLAVALDGQAPYEIRLTTTVPASSLSRLRTGVDVGVRVDPSEPQHLAIDWSAD
jgi:hypothetical protein